MNQKQILPNAELAHILLVDDSPADQITVERALEDGKVKCRLSIVDNGKEALAFLLNQEPFEDSKRYTRPDLVLMDINMPCMDGNEALQHIRATPSIDTLPVVILTTSDSPRDIDTSYSAGANAYITKPVDEKGFIDAVQKLDRFWFQLVTLPAKTSSTT